MRKIRGCNAAQLNTGKSKCPINLREVEGALIVPTGTKLPATLTGEALEKACHAAASSRVRPVFPFVEYAPNGGEVQVSATGYGANKATGISARTDAWTMDQYSEHLASAFTKAMNAEYDVYYWDKAGRIIGINDGTDQLAGIPMSTIYHGGAPFKTSSGSATQTINFCLKDAREAIEEFDYIEAGFDISRFAIGLVPVELVEVESGKYKIVEAQGGYDRTEEFAATICSSPSDVLNGTVSAASYAGGLITVTATGDVSLKEPDQLYAAGVKGIIAA